MKQVKPLLDFIKWPESRGDYNIVWNGIKGADRPAKLLTQMTIGEVLDWQDKIDPFYMSEAAGAFQIMEDTLRGMYQSAGFSRDTLFNEKTQDALAVHLLKRRGLDDFMSGEINATKFANSLAKEWASLPVVSGPKKGLSYYSGDGLNQSHVDVLPFLEVVNAIKAPEAPPAVEVPPQGLFARLADIIATIFGRNAA